MQPIQGLSPTLRILLGSACFIIIVAGMKSSAEIIVPFLLSGFIAILCATYFLVRATQTPHGLSGNRCYYHLCLKRHGYIRYRWRIS